MLRLAARSSARSGRSRGGLLARRGARASNVEERTASNELRAATRIRDMNVMMPQMGESIAEGTIVRWIKKVGEHVDRDEPLFEISTDKVDAEIPSPAAGVVAEIRVKAGEPAPVNSVVAVIGAAGEAVAVPPAPKAPESPAARPAKPQEAPAPS